MVKTTKVTSPIVDEGILLGRQGETEAREIEFDLSWLIDTYGDGTAVLVYQRPKDDAPYIVNAVQNGNTLTWTVSNTDTAYDGFGQAELRWTVGSTLAKTVIYRTMVIRSLTAGEEIPDPYESWYDAMVEYIDQLKVDSDERLVEAVTSAGQSATSAGESASQASASADTAGTKASQAAASALEASQSATAAAQSAAESATSADRAEQAAHTAGYMFFHIDSNGDLIYQRTDHVDVAFYLSDGNLFVRDGNV